MNKRLQILSILFITAMLLFGVTSCTGPNDRVEAVPQGEAYSSKDGAVWSPVSAPPKARINTGTWLKTGPSGQVNMVFGNTNHDAAKITMINDTKLQTRKPGQNDLYTQHEGTTFGMWIIADGSSIYIEGFGTVSPTGTSLRISVMKDSARIAVYEGSALFLPLSSKEYIRINVNEELTLAPKGITIQHVDYFFTPDEIRSFQELGGTYIPDIRVPINTVVFPDITLGNSQDKTITISNDGNAILTVNSISRISGSSAFTYTGALLPFNLKAGESQQVTIRFTPISDGTESAIFGVSSNDPDETNVTFAVSGMGLAPKASDVTHLAASQSVVYASTISATNPIYKSTNGGMTWSSLNPAALANLDAPAPIAVAPDDPNIVLIAGFNEAYFSTDGGVTFRALTGHGLTFINDIAISPLTAGVHYLALAGGSGDIADIAYMDLGAKIPSWVNIRTHPDWAASALSGSNVLSIAFSPNFASDKVLTAVTIDYTDGKVAARFEILSFASKKVNESAGFTGYPVQLLTSVPRVADISLSPTYLGADEATRVAFVATATGSNTGKLQRLNNTAVKDIKTGADFRSVTYNGSVLVAGSNSDNNVYYSTNPTATTPIVSETKQRPGGSSGVSVVWSGANVIAGTEGTNSTIAVSLDSGVTFEDIK